MAEEVKRVLSSFNITDIIQLVGLAMANWRAFAAIRCCLDENKIVCTGNVEGELEIKDKDLEYMLSKLLPRCEK